MNTDKKVAFLVYPGFCNYEVAFALAIFHFYGKEVILFGLDKEPVASEEGFRVLPDRTLEEFAIEDYDCVLLSGIGGMPDGVLYEKRYIDFLRQFAGREDILIASMSISPALIAQAGLLKNKKFCIAMVEEDREEFHFLDYTNQQRAPIVEDGNVITAMDNACREFAIAAAHWLGIPCSDKAFSGIEYPIKEENYIFYAQPQD